MSAKRKVFYADFETTQPDENEHVEVYLWCAVSGKKQYSGLNIESFIEWLQKLKKTIIFFHNLRFDFSYIHYYCLKNDIEVEVLEKQGVIYNAKIFDVEFRDSLNFMPMTLKEVGENYCEKYQKTSIDYDVQKGHVATPEEIEYCFNDCRVLEEGINNYLIALEDVLLNAGCHNSASKIWKKLTNAGIAYEAFKELSVFDECCPKTTRSEYELFKEAYKGGFVYSNPKGIVKDVTMIDCNSMYPYMYSHVPMPFGRGYELGTYEDTKRFEFAIIHCFLKYELKEGYIAIIGGGVGRFGSTEYKASSEGEFEELTLCNIDLELIFRFYDCEFKFIWGVGFDTKPYFFKDYADTFIAVKNKEKGIKRSVAKILLNSPYGKTAMNGFQELRTYKIDEQKGVVVGEVSGYEINDNSYQYLPMAICITAHARKYLLETAEQIGFEDIYYMDTDSIKFKTKETGIEYDPNILGAWKNEGRVQYFKTIAPKKYVYYNADNEGKICFTCAGFNKKVLKEEMHHKEEVDEQTALILMKQFDKGFTLECLQSKVVKGGRALIKLRKEIK